MSSDSAHTFMYVDCDVPPDMTLDTWRRRRTEPAGSRRRMWRALHRAAHI
jgi:hypothetical protein